MSYDIESQKQSYIANLKLVHEIQAIGINIICCNSCDTVNLHKNNNKDEKTIICVGCENEIYPNDCADLFY